MSKNELPAIRWDEKLKRWRMDARDQGQRKSFYSVKPNEKAVLADMRRQYFAWKAGEIDKLRIRFTKAWDEYLIETKKSTSASNYRQREQIGRLYLEPSLKIKIVSEITKTDWQKCINEAYSKNHLSRKTLQNIRGVISSFCHYAVEDRMMLDSEIPRLRIPQQSVKGKRKILQPEDLNRLLSEEEDPFYTNIYKFIVLTGLRRGETCGLKWQDITKTNVDGTEYVILKVERSVTEDLSISAGKTDNAKRSFILPDTVVSLLEIHKIQLKNKGIISPWIFPNVHGELISPPVLSVSWNRFRKKQVYETSLHELRHTFVSMTKNAMPLAMLQHIVGHSSKMDTYGVYGHEVDGELLEAQKIINGVIKNIKTSVKTSVNGK